MPLLGVGVQSILCSTMGLGIGTIGSVPRWGWPESRGGAPVAPESLPELEWSGGD
jgi:hypothetical protein